MSHVNARFLITGCASGIGRHLAQTLLERGGRVVATDIDQEAMHSHAEQAGWPEDQVLLEHLDVTDPEAWNEVSHRAARTWGGLDVVMNVAGYLRPNAVSEVTDEDIHRHFDINVKGVIFRCLGPWTHIRRARVYGIGP